MKVETQKNHDQWFLKLNFGDVMGKPLIRFYRGQSPLKLVSLSVMPQILDEICKIANHLKKVTYTNFNFFSTLNVFKLGRASLLCHQCKEHLGIINFNCKNTTLKTGDN